MKYIKHIPPYERVPHGFCPADDSDYICPICGEPIYWWSQVTLSDRESRLCHFECIEKEDKMEEIVNKGPVSTDLVTVVQLPVITERLSSLKDVWERRAADAEAMVCNEDTIQSIKNFRADINKDFSDIEAVRKAVKEAIMKPYNDFETAYKDCITIPKQKAEKALTDKINEVETELKRRCEENLIDYFDELCAAHHLEWLTYEQAGIKVDMASAKSKTPKKLRGQLVEFIVRVSESVERINSLDNAEEIMVEYQRTLDATQAIFTVQERHRRIEDQRADRETKEAARNAEKAAEEKVNKVYQEYLKPPTEAATIPEIEDDPVIPICTFTVINPRRSQLLKLKEFLNMEGIQYE